MRKLLTVCVIAGLSSAAVLVADDDPAESFAVSVRVHAHETIGPLREIWRFFGADEPNYAYAPNGRKLLGHLGQMRSKRVYFRAHNLLTSGDGT